MSEQNNEMREMSLKEWCAKLHKNHRVNRELAALKAEPAQPVGFDEWKRHQIAIEAFQYRGTVI